MKKILILGDYNDSRWHPLNGVDDEIKRIISGFHIEVCVEYAHLTLEALREYDIVANYIDAWRSNGNAGLAGALIGYVAGGGSLLSIHNGIIAASHPELEQMTGAKFTGHPPREVLDYIMAQPHPITDGLEPFSMDEEPYQFVMDNLAGVTVIMEYVYKGEKYPAAWVRNFGGGKVCYLSMGHEAKSFTYAGFENLLKKSVQWCAGEI